jgi:hypothetical protein
LYENIDFYENNTVISENQIVNRKRVMSVAKWAALFYNATSRAAKPTFQQS